MIQLIKRFTKTIIYVVVGPISPGKIGFDTDLKPIGSNTEKAKELFNPEARAGRMLIMIKF